MVPHHESCSIGDLLVEMMHIEVPVRPLEASWVAAVYLFIRNIGPGLSLKSGTCRFRTSRCLYGARLDTRDIQRCSMLCMQSSLSRRLDLTLTVVEGCTYCGRA